MSPSDKDALDELIETLRGKPPLHERYELGNEIGRGGMGRVIEVFDRELRRTLAMKFLRTPSDPAARREMASRFLEEARITAQLDHQGIVPIHDLGIDEEGTFYYTMRLVEGRRTLSQVFELAREGRERWNRFRALDAILRACEAVSYAHRRGVIHRDLKPANILVGPLGEVFVVDWGLSRVLEAIPGDGTEGPDATVPLDPVARDAESPFVTGPGRTPGTPYYMSPEQAQGDRDAVGARSDVYAMGAILYELLTGRPPYAEEGARFSSRELVERIRTGPPTGIEQAAPQEPPELVAICAKAMERRPEDRFPSIAELSTDLRAFLENRVVGAYETGAWAEARKWVRRNKPLSAALAATVGMLVVGLVVSLTLKARADAVTTGVLRLAGIQHHDELIEVADHLWPPHPERIEACEEWLEEARTLMAELGPYRARRNELRGKALSPADEARALEPRNEEELERLEKLRTELEVKRGADLQRRDGIRVELPDVNPDAVPRVPRKLSDLVSRYTDPARTEFGQEAEAQALLERALEIFAGDEDALSKVRSGMSWALFALGRDQEARESLEMARDLAITKDAKDSARLSRLWLGPLLDEATTQEGMRSAEEELERLQAELTELQTRSSLRFPDTAEGLADRWWHDELTRLIDTLEEMQDEQTGLLSDAEDAASPVHGWSVPRRLRFARRWRDGMAEGGEWNLRWKEAALAIRTHPEYGGLELAPQVGLVPISPDPDSGFWEFWHVATGEEPLREDGKLVPTEEMGLVLVLLPGGQFLMGSQKTDPSGPNYCSNAPDNEGPVHEVPLSPFFLSKYEMTQGQWLRLTGDDPASYGPPFRTGNPAVFGVPGTLRHPVEQVSWYDCELVLRRVGLDLPSEAQWEYGARGGTDTLWWTGSRKESLGEEDAENLRDRSLRKWLYAVEDSSFEDWDDGYVWHAPVGTYTANPFGLHDVLGNVAEWCLDSWHDYGESSEPDPVSPRKGSLNLIIRGGNWEQNAGYARSARRFGRPPSTVHITFGVRPARAIDS